MALCCATRPAAVQCGWPAGNTIPDFSHVGNHGNLDLLPRRTVSTNSDGNNIATPLLHINASKSGTTCHRLRGTAACSVTNNTGGVKAEGSDSNGLYEISL